MERVASQDSTKTLVFVLAGLGLGIVTSCSLALGLWLIVLAAVGAGLASLYFILFAPIERLDEPIPLAWQAIGAAAAMALAPLWIYLGFKLIVIFLFVLVAYVLSRIL